MDEVMFSKSKERKGRVKDLDLGALGEDGEGGRKTTVGMEHGKIVEGVDTLTLELQFDVLHDHVDRHRTVLNVWDDDVCKPLGRCNELIVRGLHKLLVLLLFSPRTHSTSVSVIFLPLFLFHCRNDRLFPLFLLSPLITK